MQSARLVAAVAELGSLDRYLTVRATFRTYLSPPVSARRGRRDYLRRRVGIHGPHSRSGCLAACGGGDFDAFRSPCERLELLSQQCRVLGLNCWRLHSVDFDRIPRTLLGRPSPNAWGYRYIPRKIITQTLGCADATLLTLNSWDDEAGAVSGR